MTTKEARSNSLEERFEELLRDFDGLRGRHFVNLSRIMERRRLVVFRDKFSRHYLDSLGLTPRTVVDVGVNYGTPDLYEAFPKAKFLLVDPHPVDLRSCMKRFPDLDYDFKQCAAGSAAGRVRFTVAQVSGHSSIKTRVGAPKEAIQEEKDVEVVRLDELLKTGGYDPPYGIKIDTEGFEQEVLKGATKILPDVEFIIAEVSIKRMFRDGYRFSEVVGLLGGNGFELFDILNARGWTPNHLDCLFLPYEHRLMRP